MKKYANHTLHTLILFYVIKVLLYIISIFIEILAVTLWKCGLSHIMSALQLFHGTNINLLVYISQIAYIPYSIPRIDAHILWIACIYHLWNSQLFRVFYSSHFYHHISTLQTFLFFDLFVQSLAVLRKCCNFAPKKKICEKNGIT